MSNTLTLQFPPFYQDKLGFWWYPVGQYTFGPYNSRDDAVEGFKLESKASGSHKMQGVWA